jgi:type IV secretory pathway VirB4 component
MLPSIVEKTEIDNIHFFSLNTFQIIAGFKLGLLDRETRGLDEIHAKLADLYSNASPEVTFKFYLKSSWENSAIETSRTEAIRQNGYINNELYFFAFIKEASIGSLFKMFGAKRSKSSFDALAYKLKSLINLEALKDTFSVFSLEQNQFESLLPEINRNYLEKNSGSVDLGAKMRGYVRLNKLAVNQIDMATLANLKDAIPTPYNIILNVRKISQTKAENLLKIRTNQSEISNTRVGVKQYQEAQEKMEQVQLQGSALLDFEFIIELERHTEADIRADADKVIQYMRNIGDFYFETFGAFPTFMSSLINGEIHHPSIETSQLLPCYTPVITYGEPAIDRAPSSRALFLHREDYSPFYLDFFKRKNESYINENFSCAVIGLSGYGKSFFTNALTRALYADADVHIIKIDVGGSHSNETKALGGAEFSLSLDRPSGINPFFILSNQSEISLDSNALISTFIKTLVTEKGEVHLSKELTADIEAAVRKYAEMRPSAASIDDFLVRVKEIPRRKLLERWGGAGSFKNAFKDSAETAAMFGKRLKYYNLAQVFQAQDPDFAQGVLAAVMSQFNIEMMKLYEQNTKNGTAKKIVFMADETPVFIKNSFEFFSFSVKNVRKFGGSLVPIVQKTEDLIVNGDSSIIDNCASKILFSLDGDRDAYAKRVKLDPASREMDVIQNFKKQGHKSQFMYIDSQGARVLNLTTTKSEYWSFTSSDHDKAKLRALMNAVPGLTVEEAIKCLSMAS